MCNKPLIIESNLKSFRESLASCTGAGILSLLALPIIGFTAGGAACMTAVGSVAEGRLFATSRNLGVTGLGTILFGAFGSALELLASCADCGWCVGHHNDVNHFRFIQCDEYANCWPTNSL